MKHIPFFTLVHQNAFLEKEIEFFYKELHAEAWYILGKRVAQFEKAYAAYNNVRHCIGVGNGLDALTLSLRALNIGKGDEVVVPANSFIATLLAVTQVGATPILAEPDKHTFNITAEEIKKKITSKTKVIIPVHLYGLPCAMEDLISLAETNNIFIVEDNAQAHGATYKNQKTGSFGIANATSFYPVKPLGAYGDGGAVTTNDAGLARQIRLLSNYGSEEKYYYETTGINSRLDEIQAGVLSIKLNYLDRWNEERIQLANLYSEILKDTEGIVLPVSSPDCKHIYHQYVIQSDKRDLLKEHLKKQGIETGIHYPVPPHLQKAYDFLNLQKGSLPVTEKLSETILSLPIYNGMKNEDVEYVCEVIRNFINKKVKPTVQ
ncbi:DegT/DnrJ/EryC1/StrS family aminotransferase [Cytophaga hutchinsonii]|uniref:Aminotransferase, DegT/DnrJ/EryC1/StrS faily n=1 Tax=Cytophaga hutchinsonii (strain ATCC 33406 / DSM 1761 / CIP 103989 / NBRC 15051 / NCIMB 9469 / D465) TaxID=269798 RepID=A0A6N4SW08_CYTH3|nr:DegT/DnrJ/EryC1/StrS family aminotransferase [Cytophaga hutchinsonii]ABG60724.1 aminotransferase, DegT/DnrJ/EryC1/StrS faily [Cytophaga hutchinsonii ATCC 33406]SFX70530.1 dTDP-4-amino-4,6-dideoxygalactose transaminase [Cytophaga hutchinsonii ATCC 33406]